MSQTPQITLNDGSSIPAIGFGTYPMVGQAGFEARRRRSPVAIASSTLP